MTTNNSIYIRIIPIFLLSSLYSICTFAENNKASIHFKKGHKFYLDSKSEQSEIEFRKALKLNPQLSDAYYYLSSIYFKQDKYKEAIQECNKALKIKPDDLKSLIILGLSFQQLNLIDPAIETFQKAVSVDNLDFRTF